MSQDRSIPPLDPWPVELAQAAVAATHNVLLTLDATGTIQHANPAALQALCLQLPAVCGRHFVDLLDVGSRAKGQRLLADVLSHSSTAVVELNHVTGDGNIVMIGYRALLLPQTAAGPQVLLIGQATAEMVATTERLIALNRRLSALFTLAATASRSLILPDLLQQALAVILTELQLQAGAILLAAVPVELDRALHAPREPHQLRVAAHQGFAPAFVERLADIESLTAFWNTTTRAEQQSVVQGTADEVGMQVSDLLYATGPLLTVGATPIMAETNLLGWLYVVTDRYDALPPDELELLSSVGNLLGPPVENARLYDALRETSGQLGAVLDGIDSGVLLTDQDGLVRYANARLGSLLEVTVAEWPGQPRADIMRSALQPVTQHTALFEGELWQVVAGEGRILRRFVQPVADHTGQPLGSLEVYSDVTQLLKTDQLRDEFVAAAAHDLKTPVTAVKGYAQIALRVASKLNEPRLVQQLTMINARSDDLALLMDSLLDMSRIQAGRLQLQISPVLVQDLVKHVIKHFDFDLQRKQRTITCQLPDEPLEVAWDRHRMEGVLINLIGNALKYSPDGGDIHLYARRIMQTADQGSYAVELTVTDHGIGIPPAERELIFQRFYRAREAVEHGFRGTGIGLYISHMIVHLHGGQMRAADALHGGQGTTMHIVLPTTAASAQHAGGMEDSPTV